MPLKSGVFSSFLGSVYHTVFTHKEYGNKYVGLRHDSNMATLIIILMSTHDMADANLCQEYRAFWGMTSGKSFKVTSNLLWKVFSKVTVVSYQNESFSSK